MIDIVNFIKEAKTFFEPLQLINSSANSISIIVSNPFVFKSIMCHLKLAPSKQIGQHKLLYSLHQFPTRQLIIINNSDSNLCKCLLYKVKQYSFSNIPRLIISIYWWDVHSIKMYDLVGGGYKYILFVKMVERFVVGLG